VHLLGLDEIFDFKSAQIEIFFPNPSGRVLILKSRSIRLISLSPNAHATPETMNHILALLDGVTDQIET